MTHAIYVSEPDTINIEQIKAILANEEYVITAGTFPFSGEDLDRYDTIIIRSETKIDDQVKTFFPNVKNIIRIGTGLDNVDLSFCKREDIAVYNAAGANAEAVSEYVVGIILYVTRKLYSLSTQDLVEWNRFKFIGTSLSDQTIGLIGFGHIGRLLLTKLKGFNCKGFLVYDPYIKVEDMPEGAKLVSSIEDVVKGSSIISIHVPLTDETVNIIDASMLELLQPNAILINASRGGIVDEMAVIRSLDESASFMYIADTIANEPHGNADLFDHENIIITPHIASLTDQSERQMTQVAIQNLLQNKHINL